MHFQHVQRWGKKNRHNILTLWIFKVSQVMTIVAQCVRVSGRAPAHWRRNMRRVSSLKNKLKSQQPALAVCLPANIHRKQPTVHILWTAFDTTLACRPPIVERRIRLDNLLLKTWKWVIVSLVPMLFSSGRLLIHTSNDKLKDAGFVQDSQYLYLLWQPHLIPKSTQWLKICTIWTIYSTKRTEQTKYRTLSNF